MSEQTAPPRKCWTNFTRFYIDENSIKWVNEQDAGLLCEDLQKQVERLEKELSELKNGR